MKYGSLWILAKFLILRMSFGDYIIRRIIIFIVYINGIIIYDPN